MSDTQKKVTTAEEKAARKKELKELLHAKIEEKRISRSSKQQKEAVLDQTLKKIGIDKDKFRADLEAVRKQGGLEVNMKQN